MSATCACVSEVTGLFAETTATTSSARAPPPTLASARRADRATATGAIDLCIVERHARRAPLDAAGEPPVLAQQVAHGLGRERPAEIVSLQDVAVALGKEVELRLGFHAFGHHLEVEAVRHRDDRL